MNLNNVRQGIIGAFPSKYLLSISKIYTALKHRCLIQVDQQMLLELHHPLVSSEEPVGASAAIAEAAAVLAKAQQQKKKAEKKALAIR